MTAALPSTDKIKGLASLPVDLRKLAPRLLARIGRDGAHVRLEQLYRWGAGELATGPEVRALVVALIAEDKAQKSIPGKDPRMVRDSDTVCLTSRGQAQLTALRVEATKAAAPPPAPKPAPKAEEDDQEEEEDEADEEVEASDDDEADEEEAPESAENDAGGDDCNDDEEAEVEAPADEEVEEEDGDCDDARPAELVASAPAPTPRGKVQVEHAASTRDAIVALLTREGEMTSKEILKAIPQSRSGVMRALKRLVDNEVIVRSDYGKYAVAGAEPAPVAQVEAPRRNASVTPVPVSLDELLLLRCLSMSPEQRAAFVKAWEDVLVTREARQEIERREAAAVAQMASLLSGSTPAQPAPRPAPVAAPQTSKPAPHLTPKAKEVLTFLRRQRKPTPASVVRDKLDIPEGTATGSLSVLGKLGLAERVDGGWRAVA